VLEGVESQLETNLIVTLTSASVRYKLAAFTVSDLDLLTGNDGTSKGSTQEVVSLVDGVSLNSREDEFFDKLLLQVL
jgi:hypothetical protein